MQIRILMATATAASVLMATAAMAGSGNTLYLTQQGNGNGANISQGAADNSDIGTVGLAAKQQGNNNRIGFTVGASSNGGNDNNDIVQFLQFGNTNLFEGGASGTANDGSGNAHDNKLNNFKQQGDGNGAYVNWTLASYSTVDDVQVVGNRNTITLQQGDWLHPGTNNTIGTVWIVGDQNGNTAGNGWLHAVGDSGIHISQLGSYNKVTRSEIQGSNNAAKVHEILQTGNSNGLTASTAVTLGSDGNFIKVNQTGDWNNFSVMQGVSTASTQNEATLIQTGNYNAATITEYGSYNTVFAKQIGNSNTISASITGDFNGSGTFTNGSLDHSGKGPLLLANTSGLNSGDIFQLTSNNLVDISITSNSNQFAVLQQGGNYNTVTGTISGGNNNQVVAVQNGASNSTVFAQVGSNNQTTVSQ